MNFKDEEPINFQFFQSDMEKIQYQLTQAIKGEPNAFQLSLIYNDLNRKIKIHKERGEWK